MMRVLLVEDDENKRRQIAELIAVVDPEGSLEHARSLRGGVRELQNGPWDLIILDMSIPSFDVSRDEPGGSPQALGGRDLLWHIRRLNIDAPVIVVTQYDEFDDGGKTLTLDDVERLIKDEHGPNYLGAIVYNVVFDAWKDDLRQTLTEIMTDEHSR